MTVNCRVWPSGKGTSFMLDKALLAAGLSLHFNPVTIFFKTCGYGNSLVTAQHSSTSSIYTPELSTLPSALTEKWLTSLPVMTSWW